MTQPTRPHLSRTEPGRASAVRRLPTPVCEPPYDIGPLQRPANPSLVGGVQGSLALAFTLPSGLPAVPQPPPDLRLLRRPPAGTRAGDLAEEWAEPQLTSRALLPDPAPWAARLTQALVEVLAGQRPVAQLVRWTSGEVYDRLRRRCAVTRVCDTDLRALVRTVSVTEPVDGVAEVAALVRRGPRCTALALRLEGLDGRWQCTAVELR